MKKNNPKTKVNDVFMHLDDKKMFIVEDINTYNKGKLYTLKEISKENEVSYKRYYEDKLAEKCVKTKNTKAIKLLYGKK